MDNKKPRTTTTTMTATAITYSCSTRSKSIWFCSRDRQGVSMTDTYPPRVYQLRVTAQGTYLPPCLAAFPSMTVVESSPVDTEDPPVANNIPVPKKAKSENGGHIVKASINQSVHWYFTRTTDPMILAGKGLGCGYYTNTQKRKRLHL